MEVKVQQLQQSVSSLIFESIPKCKQESPCRLQPAVSFCVRLRPWESACTSPACDGRRRQSPNEKLNIGVIGAEAAAARI